MVGFCPTAASLNFLHLFFFTSTQCPEKSFFIKKKKIRNVKDAIIVVLLPIFNAVQVEFFLSFHFFILYFFFFELRGQLLNIPFCVCLIMNFFFDKYIDFFHLFYFFREFALFNLPFNFSQVFFDVKTCIFISTVFANLHNKKEELMFFN